MDKDVLDVHYWLLPVDENNLRCQVAGYRCLKDYLVSNGLKVCKWKDTGLIKELITPSGEKMRFGKFVQYSKVGIKNVKSFGASLNLIKNEKLSHSDCRVKSAKTVPTVAKGKPTVAKGHLSDQSECNYNKVKKTNSYTEKLQPVLSPSSRPHSARMPCRDQTKMLPLQPTVVKGQPTVAKEHLSERSECNYNKVKKTNSYTEKLQPVLSPASKPHSARMPCRDQTKMLPLQPTVVKGQPTVAKGHLSDQSECNYKVKKTNSYTEKLQPVLLPASRPHSARMPCRDQTKMLPLQRAKTIFLSLKPNDSLPKKIEGENTSQTSLDKGKPPISPRKQALTQKSVPINFSAKSTPNLKRYKKPSSAMKQNTVGLSKNSSTEHVEINIENPKHEAELGEMHKPTMESESHSTICLSEQEIENIVARSSSHTLKAGEEKPVSSKDLAVPAYSYKEEICPSEEKDEMVEIQTNLSFQRTDDLLENEYRGTEKESPIQKELYNTNHNLILSLDEDHISKHKLDTKEWETDLYPTLIKENDSKHNLEIKITPTNLDDTDIGTESNENLNLNDITNSDSDSDSDSSFKEITIESTSTNQTPLLEHDVADICCNRSLQGLNVSGKNSPDVTPNNEDSHHLNNPREKDPNPCREINTPTLISSDAECDDEYRLEEKKAINIFTASSSRRRKIALLNGLVQEISKRDDTSEQTDSKTPWLDQDLELTEQPTMIEGLKKEFNSVDKKSSSCSVHSSHVSVKGTSSCHTIKSTTSSPYVTGSESSSSIEF